MGQIIATLQRREKQKQLDQQKKKYASINISEDELKQLIAIEIEEMLLDPKTHCYEFFDQIQFLQRDNPLVPHYRGLLVEHGSTMESGIVAIVGQITTLDVKLDDRVQMYTPSIVHVKITGPSARALLIATYYVVSCKDKQEAFQYTDVTYHDGDEQYAKQWPHRPKKVTMDWTMDATLYKRIIARFPNHCVKKPIEDYIE